MLMFFFSLSKRNINVLVIASALLKERLHESEVTVAAASGAGQTFSNADLASLTQILSIYSQHYSVLIEIFFLTF